MFLDANMDHLTSWLTHLNADLWIEISYMFECTNTLVIMMFFTLLLEFWIYGVLCDKDEFHDNNKKFEEVSDSL